MALTVSARAEAPGDDFFPFSVWYSGGKARAPMLEPLDETSRERWLRDLRTIRSLGFNAVRTWVEWTGNEPRPDQYDFSNLDLLLELAREVGLRVLVQVYTDSAPDWVGDRWADARFVAQSGDVIPSQSAPGYCFDHPEVQAKILEFYRTTARHAVRHPNFHGWDLWSEPHIINWAIIDYVPNAQFCYCPSSIRRFRSWLQRKYGSLENLNQAWYRTFTDWDQVEPPRFGTILSYTDFIDWKLYIREKLAEDLRLRAEAVRSVDPTRVTTSHAAVPGLYTSPMWGVGAPDDWLMAGSVDYWGTSIYPKHSFPDRHWSLLTLTSLMDFIRSSGLSKGGFYVGELQAGMGIRGTVVGDPVTAGDQRLRAIGMLSRGARAINVYAYYPMNSGYEAGGYGLINLDGSVTPRARELGRLAAAVDRHQKLFLAARPARSPVAVVYNPLAHLVGGEQNSGRGSTVRESLQGLHQLMWKHNLPMDFVHIREVEAGVLAQYKFVFLPYPLMLTATAARQLASFVENGGTLFSEARCGWNDDRGYSQDVIPGFGLDQVFGVREGRLKMVDTVELQPEAGAVPEGIQRLRGVELWEELIPGAATQVLATVPGVGPALTVRSHGRGRAYMAGTFVGAALAREADPQTESFLAAILREAGVRPVMELSGLESQDQVEVRTLDGPEGRLLFLFNHGPRAVRLSLPVNSLTDLELDQSVDPGAVVLEAGTVRMFLER